MGTFYPWCKVENIVDRGKSAAVSRLLVDTGNEYTWSPSPTLERIGIEPEKRDLAFVMANGQQVTRTVGFAIVRVDKHLTVDEVVFAQKGIFCCSEREPLKV